MDYWYVLALTYRRDEAFIIEMSEDIDDLMDDELGSDFLYTYGYGWVKAGTRPGLYRLTVSFPIDDKGDEDVNTDFTIDAVECLVEFPPLISTRPADEFTTIRARMEQIAREGS